MSAIDCAREQDVLDAIASRRWPAHCDEELLAHVATCASCADLVEVAKAFLDAPNLEDDSAEVPSASLVWWRAQLRAREDAARLARWPLRLARLAALASASVLAAVALQALWPPAWHWMAVALAWRPAFDPDAVTAIVTAVVANRAAQLAAIGWLLIAPVAAYVAFARD